MEATIDRLGLDGQHEVVGWRLRRVRTLRRGQVVKTERLLLQQTVQGMVDWAARLLSAPGSAAYQQALRLKWYVNHMALDVGLTDDLWQFQLAAILCPISSFMMPTEGLTRQQAGSESHVSQDRRSMRCLGPVADMLARQRNPYRPPDFETSADQYRIDLGSQMLHVAVDFDRLVSRGMPRRLALAEMEERRGEYHLDLLSALHSLSDTPHCRQQAVPDIDVLRRF